MARMRGTTMSTARAFSAKSQMSRRGRTGPRGGKNVNSRRRNRPNPVPTGQIARAIKGPDLGAG